MAYAEQVGVYLHDGGSRGEMHFLYNSIGSNNRTVRNLRTQERPPKFVKNIKTFLTHSDMTDRFPISFVQSF